MELIIIIISQQKFVKDGNIFTIILLLGGFGINYDQVVASDTIPKNLIQSRDNCNMHRVSSTGTNAGSRALPFDAGETNVSGIGHLQPSMSEFRCDLPGCGQAANSPKLNTCTGACLKLMLSFSYIFVL